MKLKTVSKNKIKKVAVIGSNSFSGGHFIDYILTNTNWRVIGISRSPEYSEIFLPYFRNKNKLKRFRFFKFNLVNDSRRISDLMDREKPEVIVNFAAQSNVPASWKNPEQWFKTNCLAIIKLANYLKDVSYLKKYIQISTPEVYGSCKNFKETLTYFNPTTPYAASKAAGDLYLAVLFKNFSFPVSFVRSANVYGPSQQLYRIIPNAIIKLKRQKEFLMKAPDIKRNFIHITDVAGGVLKVILKGKTGEVYHFSSGKNITMKGLVELICEKLGINPKKAIKVSEKFEIRDDIYNLNFNKTSEALNWKPKITLENGINGVVEWINESWEELTKYPLEYIHKE